MSQLSTAINHSGKPDMRLADRAEINDLIFRYARGLDRADWDMVASVYHPDATDEHGDYKGSAAGFIDSLRDRHVHVEQSLHVMSNIFIEFTGADSALVETYFMSTQRVMPGLGTARSNYITQFPLADDGAIQTRICGRYIDEITRRSFAWRIQHRLVLFEVYEAAPTVPGGKLKPGWALARRDGSDPVQLKRAALGLQ